MDGEIEEVCEDSDIMSILECTSINKHQDFMDEP